MLLQLEVVSCACVVHGKCFGLYSLRPVSVERRKLYTSVVCFAILPILLWIIIKLQFTYFIMARFENVSTYDVTGLVRPGCSMFVRLTRMFNNMCVCTRWFNFPRITKICRQSFRKILWRQKIIILVVIQVSTKTTCTTWKLY